MRCTLRRIRGSVFGGALLLLGCAGSTTLVEIPPRVDLHALGRIGFLELAAEGEEALAVLASRRLLQTIQSAQPGVPILELGTQRQVLAAVERDTLDFEAVRAIGERYQVDALLVGELEVREVKPRLKVSHSLTSLKAKAEVDASLRLRLLEAGGGATLWTGFARGSEDLARLRLSSRGPAGFGASSLEDVHRRLADGLVSSVTADFYTRYERH